MNNKAYKFKLCIHAVPLISKISIFIQIIKYQDTTFIIY